MTFRQPTPLLLLTLGDLGNFLTGRWQSGVHTYSFPRYLSVTVAWASDKTAVITIIPKATSSTK